MVFPEPNAVSTSKADLRHGNHCNGKSPLISLTGQSSGIWFLNEATSQLVLSHRYLCYNSGSVAQPFGRTVPGFDMQRSHSQSPSTEPLGGDNGDGVVHG